MQFHRYFLTFFTAFNFDFSSKGNFLGVLTDSSSAQRNGFLAAYRKYTGGRIDGMKYLKECYYMYWMQSVQRVSSHHSIVPLAKRKGNNSSPLLLTMKCYKDFHYYGDGCHGAMVVGSYGVISMIFNVGLVRGRLGTLMLRYINLCLRSSSRSPCF